MQQAGHRVSCGQLYRKVSHLYSIRHQDNVPQHAWLNLYLEALYMVYLDNHGRRACVHNGYNSMLR